ncbi:MAG TPA: hypothetical protein VK002_12695 [Rubricoccaceae bacterium]|nr:hypothetical protein [Rubricoccaceae bacterium]
MFHAGVYFLNEGTNIRQTYGALQPWRFGGSAYFRMLAPDQGEPVLEPSS